MTLSRCCRSPRRRQKVTKCVREGLPGEATDLRAQAQRRDYIRGDRQIEKADLRIRASVITIIVFRFPLGHLANLRGRTGATAGREQRLFQRRLAESRERSGARQRKSLNTRNAIRLNRVVKQDVDHRQRKSLNRHNSTCLFASSLFPAPHVVRDCQFNQYFKSLFPRAPLMHYKRRKLDG